jgi:signal transduction histidine kinase/CheY-like chemotaxis protein
VFLQQGIIGVTSMALLDRKSVTEVGTLVSVVASDKSEQGTISTHSVTLQSCPTDESYYQDKIYEDLITVQASSQLLLLLINNLLDVRKIESGMMETIDLQCVDLSAIVDECLQTLKPLASLSDIEFHVDRDFMGNQSRSRLVALGNPLRVQQVLINLVGNAIKYSSTSSTASVEQCSYLDVNIRRSTLARAQQEACRALCTSFDATKPSAINSSDDCPVLIVDVRDRGNGIPVDEADKVFAEFAMLERDAGKSKGFAQPTGSGLGLQLCTKLCANMKGCVWANNCDSDCDSDEMNIDTAGCMFSFYLECPSSEQEEAYINLQHGIGMEVSVERKQERDVLDGQRRFFPSHAEDIRVLVLDDVKINVRVISRMLTKLGVASTHVRGATSGVQALQVRIFVQLYFVLPCLALSVSLSHVAHLFLFLPCCQMLREDDACDLILTDMQMPGMNGLEFTAMARELYADKRKQAPFIVLCSADYSSSLETQCNELGLEGKHIRMVRVCVRAMSFVTQSIRSFRLYDMVWYRTASKANCRCRLVLLSGKL